MALPAGTKGQEGCVFELGSRLGLPVAGYENIDFHPMSDLNVSKSVVFGSHRVIVKLLAPEREP